MQVKLTRRCEQTVEREILRLQEEYGLQMSPDEIVQALLEQHRLKLRLIARGDNAPRTLQWIWMLRSFEDE